MATHPHIPPQALAEMALFRGLPDTALEAAAATARVRCLRKDSRIFNQGDEEVRAHAVIQGAVRIAQTGSDGAQVVVRFIGSGEMFGTVALFTDGRYPADAITLSDTLEVSWSEADLLELLARFPPIATNLIRIIGSRLQEAQNRIRELATYRAERRVAHAILRLARQGSGNGTAIRFPLRRKDVADISGTTLHTASRILTRWEKAGLLVTNNQHVTIRRPAELLRIAEDSAG